MYTIDRASASKKVSQFFGEIPRLLREMRHQQWLYFRVRKISPWGTLSWVASHADIWKSVSFGLAIAINGLVLMCGYEYMGIFIPRIRAYAFPIYGHIHSPYIGICIPHMSRPLVICMHVPVLARRYAFPVKGHPFGVCIFPCAQVLRAPGGVPSAHVRLQSAAGVRAHCDMHSRMRSPCD